MCFYKQLLEKNEMESLILKREYIKLSCSLEIFISYIEKVDMVIALNKDILIWNFGNYWKSSI